MNQFSSEPVHHRIMMFRLGEQWFGIPSIFCVETLPRLPITKVPFKSDAFFLGVILNHADLYLCIEVRQLLTGCNSAESHPQHLRHVFPRLLLIKVLGELWVFEVDEVSGLQTIEDLCINADFTNENDLLSAQFELDGRQVFLIDAIKLANTMKARFNEIC